MKVKTIALLGIDGCGKSTMSVVVKDTLESKGYSVKIVPFHKWVFAHKLRNLFGSIIDKDRVGRNAPYLPSRKSFSSKIKPPIAFLDNLLFLLFNAPWKKHEIYIYDRYVCATQIKFSALNYSNRWFKKLWWSIKPDYAIIFDIDLPEAVKRQIERNDPYSYPEEILGIERKFYLEYSKTHNFPVIKSRGIEQTRVKVIGLLEGLNILNSGVR